MEDTDEYSYLVSERDFLSLLIELYRNRPLLWKVKHKQYLDKVARAQAFDEIVKELQTYKPDFTVEKVKKKINIIRTNYNKQKHRLEKYRAQGKTDIVPGLWYFNEMLFLDEQELTPRARHRMKRSLSIGISSNISPSCSRNKQLPDRSATDLPNLSNSGNAEQDDSESSACSSDTSSSSPVDVEENPELSDSKPYEDQDCKEEEDDPLEKSTKLDRYKNVRVKRRKMYQAHETAEDEKEDSDSEQYMTITTTYFKKKKKRENVLAETWAMKLKKMAADQKLFAEKIINDVLYEGELGHLTKNGVSFHSY